MVLLSIPARRAGALEFEPGAGVRSAEGDAMQHGTKD